MSLCSGAGMARPNLRSRGPFGSSVWCHRTHSVAPAYPRPSPHPPRTTMTRTHTIALLAAGALATTAGVASAQSGYGPAGPSQAGPAPASAPAPAAPSSGKNKIDVSVFAPNNGDHVNPTGWFVDVAADYKTGLSRPGFTTPQLTGPGAHANVAPAPGAFGLGHDDKWPGLIVLVSTAKAGPGQNLANLFNLTGLTNRKKNDNQLWSTWLVGAPNFGASTTANVYVAIAADKNGNGVYDDAPDVVPDANGDGLVGVKDLKAFGVASNIVKRQISIGG